jgi:hypothetical protein
MLYHRTEVVGNSDKDGDDEEEESWTSDGSRI